MASRYDHPATMSNSTTKRFSQSCHILLFQGSLRQSPGYWSSFVGARSSRIVKFAKILIVILIIFVLSVTHRSKIILFSACNLECFVIAIKTSKYGDLTLTSQTTVKSCIFDAFFSFGPLEPVCSVIHNSFHNNSSWLTIVRLVLGIPFSDWTPTRIVCPHPNHVLDLFEGMFSGNCPRAWTALASQCKR